MSFSCNVPNTASLPTSPNIALFSISDRLNLSNTSSRLGFAQNIPKISTNWAVICFLLIISIWLPARLRCKNTPLRHIPGPWFASHSILYRFYYTTIKGTWHHKLTNLHRQYGDIVRIAPNEVSVWDPCAIREIYAYGNRGYPKSEMYDTALPNGYFNIAVERNIARHAAGRRAIAKDYNMASTLANETHYDNIVHEFIVALDQNFAATGKSCDFSAWSAYFTYDMITDLLYGKAFGFCESASDVGSGIQELRQMLHLSTLGSFMPWIWGLARNKYIKAAVESHFSASTRREIDRRLRNGNTTGRHDLLQGLFEARSRTGTPLPLGEVTNHAYTILLAAPDTVAVTLCKIISNLAQHPAVLTALLTQLRDANVSATPTWTQLAAAPLLLAVVKETLRLHPPAGFTLPRTVPARGRTMCGTYLPAGTTVGMSAWCVHANEAFWGADTLEFKPERWLDPVAAQRLETYGMSFGQGARVCLGRPMALVQLAKATAQLVLNFEFILDESSTARDMFLMLVVLDGLKVRFMRRKGGPLDV